jgi:hypothetical protein
MMSECAHCAAATASQPYGIYICVIQPAVGWSQVQEPTGQVDQREWQSSAAR